MLGRFTVGYVVSVTAAAAIGFMLINWAAKKWPHAPLVAPISRGIRG